MRGDDGGDLGGGFFFWARGCVQNCLDSAGASHNMGGLVALHDALTAALTGKSGMAVPPTASIISLEGLFALFLPLLGG